MKAAALLVKEQGFQAIALAIVAAGLIAIGEAADQVDRFIAILGPPGDGTDGSIGLGRESGFLTGNLLTSTNILAQGVNTTERGDLREQRPLAPDRRGGRVGTSGAAVLDRSRHLRTG